MVAFSVAMFANSYWYRGVDNTWGATAMTVSTDGLYEYIQSSSNANQFKIATSEEGWDYGWTYVQAGFNSTDVTNIGDYSQDNCYCWQSGDYYILVYYPNTAVNTTANPIICASTTLPGAAAEDGSVIKLTFNCYNSTSGDKGQSETKLAGLFDKASLAYVDTTAAKTLDKVYLGRKYKEGNDSIFSNLKIGSSSAAGEFKFALANPTEVDSIVFRTAMYANNEGGDGFSVNGTAFTLSAGKLAFEDKVWKPEGEVSSIDIVQTKANKGRFFLTSITIYPKSEEDPGEDPEEPVDSMTVYFYNSLGWENVNAFVWPAEGAAYKEWPGEAAKKEAEQIHGVDVYAYTFPAANVNVIFNNGAAQTANLAWDAGKPYFVPGATDESEHYTGTWYAKAEIPAFYITGNAALVGEEKQWTPGAIPSENDTLVLDLEAGKQYMLKVTLGNDWNHGVLGYDALSENPAGIIRGEGDDNDNICFTLAEAGQVKVVYIKGEGEEFTFKMFGNFYVAPVEKDSIFFVNVSDWAAVRVHLWGGSAAGTEWPGVEMTLEEEQINGHDVYKFIADKGAYANCIFSDKGDNQTGNLDWNSGKYYYVDAWYAKEDIPTVQPEDVVFTVNVPEGTDSVFIAGTFNDWTFEKMNHVEGLQYTITKNIVKNGIEYKYTAGPDWAYVEDLEGNRTWAALDEVSAWKAVPQAPFEKHDFFITGTANLVGSEELAWKPNAIPVDGTSKVLHLGAGTYEMKIVLDSCGASNCQQWFGCERLSDEQVEGVACSKVGNIEFALAGEEDVMVTVNLTDTIITLTGNFYNIQMVNIRLVPGAEWAQANAKFAAVTWRDGQEMENDGVFTDWFVGTGDTVVGQIPEDATQIAFARFAPSVETPFMNPDDENFWNHSDKLIIEPSMIYTVLGFEVEGRNFCPGYWGEKPDFIANGYFLLGTFNEWTPSAAYEFGLVDEEGQRKVTAALAVDDHLKVAKFDRGYRVQWFPAEAGDYIVDADHAGSAQDVYFREDYGGADDWHAHCIYVVKNGATAIDNTAIDAKAEKMLRNGMILIIKGDKTYNVMGQIVK